MYQFETGIKIFAEKFIPAENLLFKCNFVPTIYMDASFILQRQILFNALYMIGT